MKKLVSYNYVNAFKNILTLHTVKLVKHERNKSKDADYIERVTFKITINNPFFEYNIFFVHRLVFDVGIPVYYVIMPSMNMSLREKSYYKILEKIYERAT